MVNTVHCTDIRNIINHIIAGPEWDGNILVGLLQIYQLVGNKSGVSTATI